MRRRSVLLALAVSVASLSVQASDRVFDSDSGHACFVDLLRQAAWGLGGPYERAAFVVEDENGGIQCVVWPNRHSYLEESYVGPIPDRTVAIVHTHPVDFPMPSRHDIDEAAKIGRPIYVLTIRGVYRADPQRNDVATLAVGRSWLRQNPNTPKVAMSATAAASR